MDTENLRQNQYEYSKYLANRIINKLMIAKEYKLCAFVSCSLFVGIRPRDVLNLKWEQFDFKNNIIHSVKLTKLSTQCKENITHDYCIFDFLNSREFRDVLTEWKKETNDKVNVFPKLKLYDTTDRIRHITGVFNYDNHILRQIYTILVLSCVK